MLTLTDSRYHLSGHAAMHAIAQAACGPSDNLKCLAKRVSFIEQQASYIGSPPDYQRQIMAPECHVPVISWMVLTHPKMPKPPGSANIQCASPCLPNATGTNP